VNIALLGGVAAKEVIISTLGTVYSLGETDPEAAGPLAERIAADPGFSRGAALSLIVFILLYSPCFVTVVAMAKEVGWRWAAFAVVANTILAFVLAVGVFQASRLLG